MSFSELHNMVALYAKARRPQMTAEAKAWRHEFLSWKSIKHFLEHSLHDQCVRDILRTYVPHDAELKFDGTMGKRFYVFFSILYLYQKVPMQWVLSTPSRGW